MILLKPHASLFNESGTRTIRPKFFWEGDASGETRPGVSDDDDRALHGTTLNRTTMSSTSRVPPDAAVRFDKCLDGHVSNPLRLFLTILIRAESGPTGQLLPSYDLLAKPTTFVDNQ